MICFVGKDLARFVLRVQLWKPRCTVIMKQLRCLQRIIAAEHHEHVQWNDPNSAEGKSIN